MDFSSLRPENVKKILPSSSKIYPISSLHAFNAIREKPCVLLACNTRIKHVIPGIMKAAKELRAIVGFELAKTECNLSGGYTGMTPKDFVNTLIEYADLMEFDTPFFIHADHMRVESTSPIEINEVKELIQHQVSAGFTSIAIDASFNKLPDNIKISSELGKIANDNKLGLEVEVGEIKSVKTGGALTTKEEAMEFIDGIIDSGISPSLLAINNGSKHGHYSSDEKVLIDLDRTLDIANSLKGKIIGIAQHGISGTPDDIMSKFKQYGIKKGNVGTLWQDIAHEYLPETLINTLKTWAKENNKNIKYSTVVFKNEIDNIPLKYKKAIEDEAFKQAKHLITIFGSEASADAL